MKNFANNPRTMRAGKVDALKKDLKELGDISGIVHDVSTDELVGGNHRMMAMFGKSAEGFNLKEAEIEIIKTYSKPTRTGTVAEGFILWEGERYSYRKVKWNEKKFKRANIVANLQKADWDWDKIANNFSDIDLVEWGFDHDFIDTQIGNLVGSRELVSAFEFRKGSLNVEEDEEAPKSEEDGSDGDTNFKEVNEGNVKTDHVCPKCGFTFNEKASKNGNKKNK